MEKRQKKQILDLFCDATNQEFQAYCQRHGRDAQRFESFITYAIDFNFISDSTIQQHAIKKAYQELQDSNLKKTERVNTLADRFNLTARSIWNILRKLN